MIDIKDVYIMMHVFETLKGDYSHILYSTPPYADDKYCPFRYRKTN